jgi:hypothetical protein
MSSDSSPDDGNDVNGDEKGDGVSVPDVTRGTNSLEDVGSSTFFGDSDG